MAVFKCKMCGGTLEVKDGAKICECEYCGSEQTVPSVNEENLQNLFNRANVLRMKAEFDKAADVYERIIQADGTEAEAYWGVVLCKYGVEYVEDPATFKRIPTCHRTSFDAVVADEDYRKAIECADISQKSIYESEAKAIDEIQKGILAVVSSESPYDVFICYKQADENNKRTVDSVIANDIYHQLTQEGFKVFYAAITLEEKLGSEYEPYIFAALNSAKVMLVLGTKPEYFDAVWVKNEWSRFMKLMRTDRSRTLIPCYRDMDAYELPEEFAHLQAQDMSKIGFISDIIRGIKKIVARSEKTEEKTSESEGVRGGLTGTGSINDNALVKRAFLSLENGDWEKADGFCEQVLNVDPENAYAYLGKLCVEMNCKSPLDLKNNVSTENVGDIMSSVNYKRMAQFCNAPELKEMIDLFRETDECKNKQWEKMRLRSEMASKLIVTGRESGVILIKADGTVVYLIDDLETDYRYEYRSVIQGWHDIISIADSSYVTIGLKSDKTVVVCVKSKFFGDYSVMGWDNIVSVAADNHHIYGVKSDGSVMVEGENDNIKRDVKTWQNIYKIVTSGVIVAGLKSDGTVVVTREEHPEYLCKVQTWRNIVSITVDDKGIAGLKSDGTVVAVDYTDIEVQKWRDIVYISRGLPYWQQHCTIGIKSDGTVVTAGQTKPFVPDVSGWRDIVDVSISSEIVVGYQQKIIALKSDGTVIVDIPNFDHENWNDIVALRQWRGGYIGIKSNGYVVISWGDSKKEKWWICDCKDIRLFNNIDTLKDELIEEPKKAKAWRIAEEKEAQRKREEAEKEAQRKRIEEEYVAKVQREYLLKSLETEKRQLSVEASNLKGIFSGKRRREIEKRLKEIEMELNEARSAVSGDIIGRMLALRQERENFK